ncbi:MAG: flagellar protein [Oscillospiraceae bacterium]|jgi:flagellar operon protein|nr:flagellar protein [Oscillospiraceae bacterium]
MNDFMLNRAIRPIVTGTPPITQSPAVPKDTNAAPATSFRSILEAQLNGNGVAFSKHAVNRVIERNIDVSGTNMERLAQGVEIAKNKGLGDTLILIDRTAFIVNAPAGKVITTVSDEDLKGNVFTNIDGTVII